MDEILQLICEILRINSNVHVICHEDTNGWVPISRAPYKEVIPICLRSVDENLKEYPRYCEYYFRNGKYCKNYPECNCKNSLFNQHLIQIWELKQVNATEYKSKVYLHDFTSEQGFIYPKIKKIDGKWYMDEWDDIYEMQPGSALGL